MPTRRYVLLTAFAVAGSTALWAPRAWTQEASRARFTSNPFTLGVASGYPTADSVVLWTRLAPEPLAPLGGVTVPVVAVGWELAEDEAFRNVVRRGVAYATPDFGYSLHVEPTELQPARRYWYRFTVGDARSPVGRTRTAPAGGSSPDRFVLAAASCQQFEHGYYAAYRHMLADDLDLVVHLGDYIYELTWGEKRVRSHNAPECITLEDYRARYALYKQESELLAAHAAYPWVFTWDDHEVENDYAGDVSERDDDRHWFMARRAAAYQAYYENLPLPRTMVPFDGRLRLHTRVTHGDLLNLWMLDERQYRSPQACPTPGKRGAARTAPCAELAEPERTMLGTAQESWLYADLKNTKARWNLLGQGVPFNYADEDPGPAQRFWTDNWNGYPAARGRLLSTLAEANTQNPVVLSGDIHSYLVSRIHERAEDPASRVLASEFVTTSITSQPTPAKTIEGIVRGNPQFLYGSGTNRGYTKIKLEPQRLNAELVSLRDVTNRESERFVEKTFVVENGRPGPVEA